MSLLSKQDHNLVIESIKFYLYNKKFDLSTDKKNSLMTLLNWVKLQNNKIIVADGCNGSTEVS